MYLSLPCPPASSSRSLVRPPITWAKQGRGGHPGRPAERPLSLGLRGRHAPQARLPDTTTGFLSRLRRRPALSRGSRGNDRALEPPRAIVSTCRYSQRVRSGRIGAERGEHLAPSLGSVRSRGSHHTDPLSRSFASSFELRSCRPQSQDD